MYRALPEVNRICCKAQRDRAYKQHMNALRNVRPSIDTRMPTVPKTIGKNMKRFEIEKQRNLQIQNQNVRLVHRLDRILREEHYCAHAPQRPYTLQGRYQKEEMLRITEENEKIIKAVQNSRPILNRNEWLNHKLDHEYQLHKNAAYKQTLPMSDIIRLEEEEMQSARRQKHYRDDDLYEVHPPQPPSSSRQEGNYRPQPPPQRTAPTIPSVEETEEKTYEVHEPTTESNQSTSISEHVNSTINNGYENQQDGQPYDEQSDLSLRKEINEQIQEGYENQQDGQPYDGQQNLSLKKEINEQVQEGYENKEDEQPYYEQQSLSIRNEIHEQVQEGIEEKRNGEQYQNDEDLSISHQISDKMQGNEENNEKDEGASQEQSGSLSLKGHMTNALENADQPEYSGQQEEYQEFNHEESPATLSLGAQIAEKLQEN